ncbi:T9SS type A sorting domain-containing protein [Taibaiella chishuiensis]|uniref:Putative secreted protein (Por secretion system target) n=1 Tax=Taibaiella chishuiensis TaxID=1434707 RepID=A0A2P8CZA8_9BACT|nr:T9SS type A sorting domain-containing protein [Taibaiella chishuiensis]PSK90301.1 putative secreted protein (Por secretion system target) [Taibaiella chishuiensis]
MKSTITRKIATAVTLLSLSAFSGTAQAQCLNAPTYGQYPSNTFIPTCAGTTASIATDCYAGEYSVVNVTSGVSYTFSSSINTDYLTIGDETGTTAFTSSVTPLVWTATVSGNVRFYTHTNATCGTQNTSRARRVQCTSSVPLPGCTTNTYPANGATGINLNPSPTFSWNPSPGASGYRFYIGGTAATATAIGIVSTPYITVLGAAPNTTYFWYVVPFNASGNATGCISSATSFTTGTVTNDDCAGAIAVSTVSGVQTADANYATQSLAGCVGTTANDVWYKVTTDFPGNFTISALAGGTGNAVLQVFSGTCGSLTSLQCVNAAGAGAIETYTVTGAAANATYYFRLYEFAGLKTTYNFVVSGSALPVTMDKLQGKVTDRGLAQLSWKTHSEQKNKGFEIQRSADGIDFRTVGFVHSKAPQGSSLEVLNYSFTDAELVTGAAYYRLVQTDIDGATEMSNTVRLSLKGMGGSEVVAIPNPVKDKVSIRINGERGASAMVQITDLSGKVVRQLQISANETQVDMSSVANGIYLLKYTDANHTQTMKITKQ